MVNLIISHYAESKGVTDYYLDFLEKNNIKYYFLKHPFYFSNLEFTELIYFDGNKKLILKKYKKLNLEVLNLIYNFFITLYIIFRYNFFSKIISFGSFNTIAPILLKLFFNYKVYFWGVDYSKKRFNFLLLNMLYLFFESISCIFSDKIISLNKKQERIRIKDHYLSKKKSYIIPNGFSNKNLDKNFSKFEKIAFIYIGSITNQHGIINFVKFLYLENKIKIPLFIFGDGEENNKLNNLIIKGNLDHLIYCFGFKNEFEITKFLKENNYKFFGIAPYLNSYSDHVIYGDALKIKEYVSYKINFISSNIIQIDKNFCKYGLIYKNSNQLLDIINKLEFINYKEIKLLELENFSWNNIYSNYDFLK